MNGIVVIIAIILALIASPIVVSAAPTVTGFEDQPGGYIANEYSDTVGIAFNNPIVLDYSKEAAPWRYQGFTHSGTKAIEQCYGKEFCTTPIQMDFIAPQKRVKIWAGYSERLARQKTVIMRALDSSGSQVAEKTAVFQPSDNPIPIQTPLEIISNNANIKSVTVNFAPDAYGNSYSNHLAVDDVEFDTAATSQCDTSIAPTVTITQPTSGQVTHYNGFELHCTISTIAPLKSAMLYVLGPHGGNNSMNLFSSSSFPRNGGTYSSGISGLLFPADPAWNDNDGTNTIKVVVQNCAGFGESSTTVNFKQCHGPGPNVTITDPNPALPAGIYMVSDLQPYFSLKGKVTSSAKLEHVSAVVTSKTTGINQFNIPLNDDGTFDQKVDPSQYLFPYENTITVIAEDSEGCSGKASTNVSLITSIGNYNHWWGFSFPNFDEDDLSWNQFVQTFGADETDICIKGCVGVPFCLPFISCCGYEVNVPTGIPDPAATAFYFAFYRNAAENGNCHGMSAVSHRFYKSKDHISNYNQSAKLVRDLSLDDHLRSNIEVIQGSRISKETITYYLENWNNANAIHVIQWAVPGDMISIWQGITVAHVMNYDSLKHYDNGTSFLYVYDNNKPQYVTNTYKPNEYPAIIIDRNKNMWSYNLKNPNQKPDIWTNDKIWNIPSSLADRDDWTIPWSFNGVMNIFSGVAAGNIVDMKGNILGLDEFNNSHENISGGLAIPISSGVKESTPLVLAVQPGDYNINVIGRNGKYSDLIMGLNCSYAIENISSNTNTRDYFGYRIVNNTSKDTELLFRTSDPKKEFEAKLFTGYGKGNKSDRRMYRIFNAQVTNRSYISMKVSPDYNSLVISNRGLDTLTYDVEFHNEVIDAKYFVPWSVPRIPDQIVTNLSVSPGETQAITPVNWGDLINSTISVVKQNQNVPPGEEFGFVEGRVYDEKTNVGVASAEMTVDYNRTGIMADALGNYRLSVKPGMHLIGANLSNYGIKPRLAVVYSNQATKLDLIASPIVVPAAPTVIGFEDHPGGYIANEYSDTVRIAFNNPIVLDYSKEAAPWRYQGFAHSGTKAIEQCYGKEFCTTPIQMDFIAPQKRVKIWVGYSERLARQKTVIMRALDSSGSQVAEKTAVFQPSDNPIPIQTPLEIISNNANIKSVTVNFAPDAYGNSYSNHLAVDDVEFDIVGPVPP